jgi:hypothetical protein
MKMKDLVQIKFMPNLIRILNETNSGVVQSNVKEFHKITDKTKDLEMGEFVVKEMNGCKCKRLPHF